MADVPEWTIGQTVSKGALRTVTQSNRLDVFVALQDSDAISVWIQPGTTGSELFWLELDNYNGQWSQGVVWPKGHIVDHVVNGRRLWFISTQDVPSTGPEPGSIADETGHWLLFGGDRNEPVPSVALTPVCWRKAIDATVIEDIGVIFRGTGIMLDEFPPGKMLIRSEPLVADDSRPMQEARFDVSQITDLSDVVDEAPRGSTPRGNVLSLSTDGQLDNQAFIAKTADDELLIAFPVIGWADQTQGLITVVHEVSWPLAFLLATGGDVEFTIAADGTISSRVVGGTGGGGDDTADFLDALPGKGPGKALVVNEDNDGYEFDEVGGADEDITDADLGRMQIRGYCTVEDLIIAGLAIDESEGTDGTHLYPDYDRAELAIRSASRAIDQFTNNRFLPVRETFEIYPMRRLLTRRIMRPRPRQPGFGFTDPDVEYESGTTLERQWETMPDSDYLWHPHNVWDNPTYSAIETSSNYFRRCLRITGATGHVREHPTSGTVTVVDGVPRLINVTHASMLPARGDSLVLKNADDDIEYAEVADVVSVSQSPTASTPGTARLLIHRGLGGTSALDAPTRFTQLLVPDDVKRAAMMLATRHYATIAAPFGVADPNLAAQPPMINWDIQVLLRPFSLQRRVA